MSNVVDLFNIVSETVMVTASWLALLDKGKKLVFVTNNSTKSRKQYANKFHFLGIYVSEPKHIDNDYRSVAMKRRNKKIM
ncbi:hypothetical protein ACS0TY_022993 [Phlomoides rotata]